MVVAAGVVVVVAAGVGAVDAWETSAGGDAEVPVPRAGVGAVVVVVVGLVVVVEGESACPPPDDACALRTWPVGARAALAGAGVSA